MKGYLEDIGIDIDRVLYNLGENLELYDSLLDKFLTDTNYDEFLQQAQLKNYEKAEMHLHTLKGVCANLGMDQLMKTANELLQLIRMHQFGDDYQYLKTQLMIEYEKMKSNLIMRPKLNE